jgi:putative DNA primase/helicase
MTNQILSSTSVIEAVHDTSLIVSVIRYEEPVGKRYELIDGKVVGSQSSRSKNAIAETLSFPSLSDFATWRMSLRTEQMIVSGTFEEICQVPVVYKGFEGFGTIAATKDHLAHRARPGVMIIDIDYKDEGEVAGLYLGGQQPYKSLGSAQEALKKVLSESDGCALMIGWSTSSNLFDQDGTLVKGTGGIRIYIPVTDASKIPMLLDVMHKRSWLNGEGWAFVGVGGVFHERSLVDLALGRPTQPDFAAPDLCDGLTQNREWQVHEGNILDPNSVALLTPGEEARYIEAVELAQNSLTPAMKVERERYLDDRTDALVRNGGDPKRALAAALQCLDSGVLLSPDTVVFEGGEIVSVFDLLTNGEPHDKKTGPDPIEPEYNGGASVSIFYWNNGGFPIISTFAHGQKSYRLQHDEDGIRAVIATKDQDDIVRALALSGVDEITTALLVGETAKALGLGNNRKIITDAVSRKRAKMSGSGGDAEVVGVPTLVNPKEPLQGAREFVAAKYTADGATTLTRSSGVFYSFNGICYHEISDDEVRADMYGFLETCFVPDNTGPATQLHPNQKMVTEVTDALKAVVHMKDCFAAPCWIDCVEDHPPADELLICSNKLLHMPTRKLEPLNPAFFSTYALSYDYNSDASKPEQFFDFLNDILGDDPEAVELLQEQFGYIVSGATSLQKILAIVGPKRAGKGVLGRLLTALVGRMNVCNPSLGSFGTNFPLQPLIGKTLALMSDARLDGSANQKAIVEHLLRVSGEDDVNVPRKGITDWSGRLGTRFMLLTNEVPRLADVSGALSGRFATLVLTKSFYGQEDPHLTDRLLTELPGILNWALDGWDRLQKQGRFTVPASSNEVMKELQYLSSPIQKFIEEQCFFTPDGGIAVEELFVAWSQWCGNEGRSHSGTKATFGRDLRAAFPEIKKRRRNIDGQRPYYYEGIVPKYITDPTQPYTSKILNPLVEGGEWIADVHPGFGPCWTRPLVRAENAESRQWS